MQIVEVKKLAESGTLKLIEALKAGRSEALTEYFKAISKLYSYSFRNMCLIFAQRENATRVEGFRAWKKLNRTVKKGEKGIVIISPIFKKSEDKEEVRFKASYVFDVSQTEGEELFKLGEAEGNPGEFLNKLKDFVVKSEIDLNYVENLNGADGISKGGSIVLKNGLTPSTEFSVLVHELAHEILHHKAEERKTKKVRELEAEAVAYVVSEAIGLKSLEASKDYIQLYDGNDELLTESLNSIHKASSQILSYLLKVEETELA